MVDQCSLELINLYAHYKNKILPLSGGLLNQPNGYVRAMAVIDNYVNKNDSDS